MSDKQKINHEKHAYPVPPDSIGTQDTDIPMYESVPQGRKRFVRSIRRRTSINYLLYSIILLIVLWIAFFIFLFSVYGSMQRTHIEDVGARASQAFPIKIDDHGMDLYRDRMRGMASSEEVAMAVFTVDDDMINVLFVVDSMGNIASELYVPVSSVMENDDIGWIYDNQGKVCKMSTVEGSYMCYGTVHDTVNGSAYLLVMKKYEIFNQQSVRLIGVLVICTVVVLLLSVMFSMFASKVQTRQIADFSQKAKRLASGDFNVRFSGDGVDEYDNLANALNAAKDEMKKAEKMQRDLVANVSHDIRTPLTMIRAYAEMLRDMPVDEKKRKKTADVIISEAERLNVLVDDVLNYSKLEAGVLEYKLEPCDLSKTAEATLMRFDIFRERDGIKFEKHIEKGAVAECDKQKIEQVLYNLVINAVNYSGDDNTVILSVAKKQDGGVRVEVSDHGKGIAPDEIDSVWDRYYRSARNKRTTVGSGLGLSICKSILMGHGAEYGVRSELGKGSTFWFELGGSGKQ